MPTSAREPLLAVKGLSAGYGKIGVLNGVDLVVYPGEIVAMLGPNGAGKTTLLRAISGLLPWTGEVTLRRQEHGRRLAARCRQRRPGARRRGPSRLHAADGRGQRAAGRLRHAGGAAQARRSRRRSTSSPRSTPSATIAP